MATATDTRADYIKREYGSLVGKTISRIRPLTEQECEDMGWEYKYSDEACVIIFTDGTCFIPMADPEGNSAGFLALATVEKVK
jgi:hypothetical protein